MRWGGEIKMFSAAVNDVKSIVNYESNSYCLLRTLWIREVNDSMLDIDLIGCHDYWIILFLWFFSSNYYALLRRWRNHFLGLIHFTPTDNYFYTDFLFFRYHFLLQGTHCIINQLLCNYICKDYVNT